MTAPTHDLPTTPATQGGPKDEMIREIIREFADVVLGIDHNVILRMTIHKRGGRAHAYYATKTEQNTYLFPTISTAKRIDRYADVQVAMKKIVNTDSSYTSGYVSSDEDAQEQLAYGLLAIAAADNIPEDTFWRMTLPTRVVPGLSELVMLAAEMAGFSQEPPIYNRYMCLLGACYPRNGGCSTDHYEGDPCCVRDGHGRPKDRSCDCRSSSGG